MFRLIITLITNGKKMKKNKNSKSPYEPQSLPGMKYISQGYEPRKFTQEEINKSDLAYQIMEKQRRNAVD